MTENSFLRHYGAKKQGKKTSATIHHILRRLQFVYMLSGIVAVSIFWDFFVQLSGIWERVMLLLSIIAQSQLVENTG
jgi:hypothetical protein